MNILRDPPEIQDPAFNNYSFPLDTFQKNAIVSINQNHNVLVTAATGSGKSLVAEYAIETGVKKGKKVIKFEYRNNDGVIGGKFNKHEMYQALTDNDTLQTPWVNFLREHQEEIMSLKKVPTPIDDINDAILMFHITESMDDGDFGELLNTLKTI